jgi:MEMO1 family protein
MALKPWFNERNLFIFSTDFSHYPSYSDAQEADKATCDAIVSGSSDDLMKFLSSYQRKNIPDLATNLCGWTSILVMLNLIDHDPAIKISPVQYLNSGDSKYGDKKQVVGYWSMALTRQAANFDFTHEEKLLLLNAARNTIRKFIRERRMPGSNPADYSDKLKIHAGAFVTLKEAGALRGCIGRFSTDIPLYKLIMELAVASATEDSRFEPVTEGEIDQLEIEISVLSPLKKITIPEDILLGKHGIYIKKGYASGTFLPQVANETGWTIDEFLGHCARDKAGIGWNGWKDAELFIYEACVFSENELNVHKD